MQKQTEIVSNLARQLFEASRSKSWFGQAARHATIQGLLDQLGSIGDVSGLSVAAHFLPDSAEGIRESARNAVAKLMASMSPYELIHSSGYFTWSYYWEVSPSWHNITPSCAKMKSDDMGRVRYWKRTASGVQTGIRELSIRA